MNNQERDTHFQGFAKLLYDDFLQLAREDTSDMLAPDYGETWRMKVEHLIAERAYDLMEHIMLYAPAVPVPDMTEWPEYGAK